MKIVNIDEVLKVLHKYGEFIFVTDNPKYLEMENEISNLPNVYPKNDNLVLENIKEIINDPAHKDDLIRYCLIKEMVEEV